MQYDLNNSPYDEQYNTVLKDDPQYHKYPQPSLENDQKYIPYGENNQADVTVLNPPLENNAELQSETNDGYAVESASRPHDNAKAPEDIPNYNHVSAGTSPQEQYQQGTFSQIYVKDSVVSNWDLVKFPRKFIEKSNFIWTSSQRFFSDFHFILELYI